MNYTGLVNVFNWILTRINPVTQVSTPLTLIGDLHPWVNGCPTCCMQVSCTARGKPFHMVRVGLGLV